jgi:Flp pilus assembly protein TadG
MLCPRLIILKKRHADESGQTMVEFALVGAVFLLLVFGMFDMAFYFYTQVTLQNAVRQAARYAITGNCSVSGSCFGNGNGNTTPGDRVTTILTTIVNSSFGLVTCGTTSGSYCTNASQVHITCQGACPGTYGDGNYNAGGPGDTVTITANYTWTPWIITHFVPSTYFPNSYTYTVSAIFKNEQFPPAT